MKTQRQPIQPLEEDKNGTVRFRENAIVRYMLDRGVVTMNDIAMLPGISQEDREQFAQLIGYSLGGFGELSYVSDETYNAAQAMHANPKKTEEQARIAALESENKHLRKQMAKMVQCAYDIDESTLKDYEKK